MGVYVYCINGYGLLSSKACSSARPLHVVEREADDAAGKDVGLAGGGVRVDGGVLVRVRLELDLEGARLAAHGLGVDAVDRDGVEDAAAEADGKVVGDREGAKVGCLSYARTKTRIRIRSTFMCTLYKLLRPRRLHPNATATIERTRK